MNELGRITVDPEQMNGQPCVRNMRLTVRRVLEALVIYPNWDDMIKEYPELDPEDIKRCLAFAANNLDSVEAGAVVSITPDQIRIRHLLIC